MTSHPAQLDTGSARRTPIDVEAGRVAALQTGTPGDPAVLLVPGFTGSKEDFAPLLDPLAAEGFHVTAIDLPGQYESPGPDDPAGYAVDRLGTVVRDVATGLGGRVHLIGHSFGGLVSRAAAIAAPHTFASLVLMSSGPSALNGARRERLDALAPLLESSGLAGLYSAMQDAAASEPGYVEPPARLTEFLERRFLAGEPAMLLGMGEALRTEPDRVAELAGSGVPAFVLYGADDDAWTPAVQDEMAGRLRAARRVIPDAAHSPAVENTDATLQALLEFWRSST